MHYTVRPATRFDAKLMAYTLRPEDDREIRAATGKAPKDVLPDCVVHEKTFLLEVEGRKLALFGVNTLTAEIGIPWMVASPLLKHHQRYFLRHCRRWVEFLGSGFKFLVNCTDARNELHHKWLRWCGFTFTTLHPEWGAAKLPFWQFEKQTNV